MGRRTWFGLIAWAWLAVGGTIVGCSAGGGTGAVDGPGAESGGGVGSSGAHGSASGSGGGAGSADTDGAVGSSSDAGSAARPSSSGGSGGGSGSSGGSGSGSGSGSSGDAAWGIGGDGGCGETLPPLSDYTQNGPFSTTTVNNSGPDGGYTVVEPMPLGQNGFKHPIAMWGNGITTTPALYPTLLNRLASNGIVVIASNSTMVTAADMTGGLDWMIAQNTASGSHQGKLDTKCLVSIGYSLGGGGAVTAGSHPDVVTTVSFHGVQGDSASLKTPLLLFTSATDTFVVPATFVTPTYNASVVKTFYATLTAAGDPSDEGHLLPVSPTDPEYAPAMAWLRLWLYGDQGGMHYFDGPNATLCQAPWTCETKEPGGASTMSGF